MRHVACRLAHKSICTLQSVIRPKGHRCLAFDPMIGYLLIIIIYKSNANHIALLSCLSLSSVSVAIAEPILFFETV
jgi:hypothetical protein